MSETLNKYLPTGIAMMLIFGMVVGGYYIQEVKKVAEQVKEQSLQNSKDVNNTRIILSQFVETWYSRQKNASIDIQNLEHSILGNLTQHRIISNETRDQILAELKGEILASEAKGQVAKIPPGLAKK